MLVSSTIMPGHWTNGKRGCATWWEEQRAFIRSIAEVLCWSPGEGRGGGGGGGGNGGAGGTEGAAAAAGLVDSKSPTEMRGNQFNRGGINLLN